MTVNLTLHDTGTRLQLAHAGFPDEESRDRHKEAWPNVLVQLDQKIEGRMIQKGD